jgi:hypothetical protein
LGLLALSAIAENRIQHRGAPAPVGRTEWISWLCSLGRGCCAAASSSTARAVRSAEKPCTAFYPAANHLFMGFPPGQRAVAVMCELVTMVRLHLPMVVTVGDAWQTQNPSRQEPALGEDDCWAGVASPTRLSLCR